VTTQDMEQRIIYAARAEIGSTDWARYVRAEIPGCNRVSWCQIFCLWTWHQCGLALDRHWVLGRGIMPGLPMSSDVKRARPGDMLYMHKQNHGALLVRFDGDRAITIDGNTAADLDGDGDTDSFSCVAERTRPISDWAAYVSIHGEIDRYLAARSDDDVPDTLPAPPLVPALDMPTVRTVTRVTDPRWERLQGKLADLGYYRGAIDGDPGPATVNAIVRDWVTRYGS